MPTTLIVLAHPERQSFNGQWADATASAAEAAGETVLWSDLYRLGFDPAEAAGHYPGRDGSAPFDPLKAQEAAAADGTLPAVVAAEVEKIMRADRIVLHFPLWWFAPPAMLKGWCDRALAHGALHSVKERFDTGRCRGKSALMCVSTGSNAHESAYNGKEGDVQMLLWPLAYTLRYLGFDVLAPRVVHGVHGYNRGDRQVVLGERLQDVLAGQADVMARWDALPRLHFNADSDFDGDGRLRMDRPSYTPFIRHTP